MHIKTDLRKKENKTYVLYVNPNGEPCTDHYATYVAVKIAPELNIDGSNLCFISGDEFNNVDRTLSFIKGNKPTLLIIQHKGGSHFLNLTDPKIYDEITNLLHKTIDNKKQYSVLEAFIAAYNLADKFGYQLDENGHIINY